MNLRSLVPSRDHPGRSEGHPFGSLHREIDRLCDDFARGFGAFDRLGAPVGLVPDIEVSETDKEIDIEVELPGIEEKDVDISLEGNALTIRGEKKIEESKNDKDKNIRMTERRYGAFYRTLPLPDGVKPDDIRATMSKGVLKVSVPKPSQGQAKKIEVKGAA